MKRTRFPRYLNCTNGCASWPPSAASIAALVREAVEEKARTRCPNLKASEWELQSYRYFMRGQANLSSNLVLGASFRHASTLGRSHFGILRPRHVDAFQLLPE